MEALDCPAGDQLVPARDSSVTLQQALALWNHDFSIRQAEHWARALEARGKEIGDGGEIPWEEAVAWVWGRPPTSSERESLTGYAQQHGLANACRLLFNSNEFLFLP
jgi:hypothetical protein